MFTWTIEGADQKTGREVVISVEAVSRDEAESEARERGILVSSVHRSVAGESDEVEAFLQQGIVPTRSKGEAHFDVAIRQERALLQIAKDVRVMRGWVVAIGLIVLVIFLFGVAIRFSARLQPGG